MTKTKVTPQVGQAGDGEPIQDQVRGPCPISVASYTSETPSTHSRGPTRHGGNEEEGGGGGTAGGNREVAIIITNLTVGPGGCRGWTIYIRGEEPARKKLHPTMGGKAPRKEFLKAGKVKKLQKYQLGMVALCEICQFQKSTKLLIQKCPFSQ